MKARQTLLLNRAVNYSFISNDATLHVEKNVDLNRPQPIADNMHNKIAHRELHR
jgi:hypothetical protein